jgi:HSP20 family protein
MAMLLPDPFEALFRLQQGLDAFRSSNWLEPGPSAGGAYPPVNVFRKGDDLVLVTEVPGINKADLDVQVKGRTLRLSGTKSVNYPDQASLHRRERLAGRFDRTLTLPMTIDAEGVRAECQDGILVLLLPRAERDKPKSIPIQ